MTLTHTLWSLLLQLLQGVDPYHMRLRACEMSNFMITPHVSCVQLYSANKYKDVVLLSAGMHNRLTIEKHAVNSLPRKYLYSHHIAAVSNRSSIFPLLSCLLSKLAKQM